MSSRAWRSDLATLKDVLWRARVELLYAPTTVLVRRSGRQGTVDRLLLALAQLLRGSGTPPARLQVIPILPIEGVVPPTGGPLCPAGPGWTRAPRTVDAPTDPVPLTSEHPPIALRTVRDCWVDVSRSGVITTEGYLIPQWSADRSDIIKLKSRSTITASPHRIIHAVPRTGRRVTRAVFMGGAAESNWYHWLIELLPRLMLLDGVPEAQDAAILVPDCAEGDNAFAQSLALFAGDRPIVHVPAEELVHCDELLWVDLPVKSVPMLAKRQDFEVGYELMHPAVVLELRDRMRAALGVSDGIVPGTRLFLDRGDYDRRAYNRCEVIDVLRPLGFEPFRPERLTLAEQAAAFARAEVIVGPSGAAWANLLFASPGVRGLCWLVPSGLGWPGFANLAAVVGADLRYLTTEPLGEEFWDSHHRVDLDRLTDALARTLEG